MYLLIPDGAQFRRVEVPAEIEAKGEAALKAFRAKPPVGAWDAAEIVGPSWPHPEPEAVPATPSGQAPVLVVSVDPATPRA